MEFVAAKIIFAALAKVLVLLRNSAVEPAVESARRTMTAATDSAGRRDDQSDNGNSYGYFRQCFWFFHNFLLLL
jgi:hypothetical protein